MDSIEKNIQKLMETTDGGIVINTINALARKTDPENRRRILEALMCYAEQGKVTFHQWYAVSCAVELVQEEETEYAAFFRQCMESDDDSKSYFGIEGYAKVMAKKSFEYLTGYIFSKDVSLEYKALIIKTVSKLSNNPFDLNRPYECREWKESDIDYEAIQAWVQNGYADGKGYEQPVCHECLQQPESAAEKIYARLDNQLLKKREKKQDPAHPSNWLIKASPTDMTHISERWKLPQYYLDFLEKASPLNADLKIKGYGTVLVYGAHNLMKGQDGYAYNPCKGEMIKDWNPDYIVIANRFGDPFCLDLSQENSPVYFAAHGMGKWEFDEAFDSFTEFIKGLG